MSSYAIAGGAGFLGAAVAAHLGRAGHQVRVLDTFSVPASRQRAEALSELSSVSVTEGDVREADACRWLCAGAEFVLHCAAPPEGAGDAVCAEVILGGALTLQAAAQEEGSLRRFLLASSSAVYGDSPSLNRHEASAPEPVTSAACALLAAEQFCRAAYRRSGLQTVCLRFFELYGPGMDWQQSQTPLAALLRGAVTGETATVRGDEARDYLYIDDAVEACLRAAQAQRGVGGKVFNIGSGRAFSSQHLRETVERVAGHPVTVQRVPSSPGEARPGRADTAAAAGLLQFTANTTLDDGLARILHKVQSNSVREKEYSFA